MVFGIKAEELKRQLDALYGKVVSYVTDQLKPLSEKDQNLETKMSNLEKRLGTANAQNTQLGGTIERLTQQLAKYETRLSGLESSQQKTGIVSEALNPKGEVNFKDVECLARTVSDTAYEKIRDYFLLQMAKKGYEKVVPDFSIWDNDSRLGIQFLVTDHQRRPHAGWNSSNVQKTTTYIESIPQLKEETTRGDNPPIKILFSETGFDNNRDYFLLQVTSNSKSDWTGKLRAELPQLLQAYMLGYSLKCLEEKRYDTTLAIQEKYALKDNPALLTRMGEIMPSDPNLATQFVAHYSSEKQ